MSLDEAQRKGIVLGLKDATGQLRERLDIDELLFRHPKTFNLFLLALAELQDETKSNKDKMGWFQIAGIHGLPLQDWDGVKASSTGKGSYCPHGTILFPTWHRPYLAMMEQTIYNKMLTIAGKFKDSDSWTQEVQKFRLPFWDYLRPRGGNTRFPGVKDRKYGTTGYGWDFSVPYILEVEQVMVYMPYDDSRPDKKESELQLINNPLFMFVFPQSNGLKDKDLDYINFQASRINTVRQDQNFSGKCNHQLLNTVLAQSRESEVETLLNLLYLPYYKDYAIFSNKAVVNKKATVFGSLEGLHDDYHGLTGGNGHMSRVPVAAFDPIFWLHHCNVDRIAAVWQAINPKSWFPDPEIPGKPTETTPLLPFRSDEKSFWSSKNARRVENFGYTYTEIQKYKSGTNLQNAFMRKYAWSSQAYNRQNLRPVIPDEMKPLPLKDSPVFQYTRGTLDSRLSREIQVVSTQEISKSIVSPTPAFQHRLLATPELSESQTVLNVAAIEGLNAPVNVKEPSQIDADISRGPPNQGDKHLLSGKPPGTDILRQWYIDTTVEKAAFNGAFTIFYFVGDFPSDLSLYATAPTKAGTNHIFTAPAEACDNCGQQAEQGLLVSDTKPISPILLDYVGNGALRSLYPEDVVPFLRSNLHWRAVGIAETQPALSEEVPGLEVAVSASVAWLYPENPVPEFVGVQAYPEVTAGRAGGIAEAGA
ncbi:MAG: hypothetical protein Q9195_004483 [Heterodermia aff. obscurata]